MAVDATGITFEPSNAFEEGFGCTTVARCEDAVGHSAKPVGGFWSRWVNAPNEPALPAVAEESTRLRFNGIYFENRANGHLVRSCAVLRLNANGTMYAMTEAPATPVEAREGELVTA